MLLVEQWYIGVDILMIACGFLNTLSLMRESANGFSFCDSIKFFCLKILKLFVVVAFCMVYIQLVQPHLFYGSMGHLMREAFEPCPRVLVEKEYKYKPRIFTTQWNPDDLSLSFLNLQNNTHNNIMDLLQAHEIGEHLACYPQVFWYFDVVCAELLFYMIAF